MILQSLVIRKLSVSDLVKPGRNHDAGIGKIPPHLA